MRYWKGSIALSPTQDYPLLRQVLRSTFVTHRQLYDFLKLDFHAHSRNAFNNRTLRLVNHKYLVRDEIPYRTEGYVYSISDKGAAELIGLGEYLIGLASRPRDGQIPNAVFHAIELNEIHLALKRSQQLVHWMPDTEIRSRNELTECGYRKDYDAVVTVRVTAQTFPLIEPEDENCVFNYCDTASSRAEITVVTRKLELKKLAIVGLGGTGSYVLDLTAKTPVKEIHIFDGDKFLQHNAFRSPGAPSGDEFRQVPSKVVYFKALYSKMHRGIISHEFFIDASNVGLLREMGFVFLCMDKSEAKKLIVAKLEEWKVPFIDVGMGIDLTDDALGGILRVTTSTPQTRDHVREKNRIPFSDGDGNDEYSRNIQIADLNALNAALAVIKWKKLFGFYRDLEHEHFSTYTIDGNTLVNEDHA